MGLFDKLNLNDISKKLNDVAQSAIEQGSNLVGSTKSNFHMNDIEKQLNKQYAELGKKYFEQVKDAPSAEDQAVVTQIKDLLVQYEQARAEYRKANGILVCPKCGAEVPMGTMYCSSCGSVVPQPSVVQTVVCPQCGRSLPAGTTFCTGCGTDVSAVAPTSAQMPLGQVTMVGGTLSSNDVQPFGVPQTQQPMYNAAPATQQPMYNAAPATQQPMYNAAPATQQPVFNAAPATQQPVFNAAPATQQPAFNAAPATQQPAFNATPATQQPQLNLQKAPAAPAVSQLNLAKEPAPTQQPVVVEKTVEAPMPQLNLQKAPAAPAAPATQQPQFNAPATQQPSGFPQGGPGTFRMDIDTTTTYGSTN